MRAPHAHRPLARCRWVAALAAQGRTAGSAAGPSGCSSDPSEVRIGTEYSTTVRDAVVGARSRVTKQSPSLRRKSESATAFEDTKISMVMYEWAGQHNSSDLGKDDAV